MMSNFCLRKYGLAVCIALVVCASSAPAITLNGNLPSGATQAYAISERKDLSTSIVSPYSLQVSGSRAAISYSVYGQYKPVLLGVVNTATSSNSILSVKTARSSGVCKRGTAKGVLYFRRTLTSTQAIESSAIKKAHGVVKYFALTRIGKRRLSQATLRKYLSTRRADLVALDSTCAPKYSDTKLGKSDFSAPSGKDASAPPESPGVFRLIKIVSSDGQALTDTSTLLLDQANVPDLVLSRSGRLYLYFAGGKLGDKDNVMAVAISDDFGTNWRYKHLVLKGYQNPHTGDPDIIYLPDGSFRLFSTSTVGSATGIIYGESSDGVTFTYKGVAASVSGSRVSDSQTFLIGETWHMYAINEVNETHWHFTSDDGTTFTLAGQVDFTLGNQKYFVGNGLMTTSGYRIFAFHLPTKDIRSLTTQDGSNWAFELNKALVFPSNSALLGSYYKDPSIVQLPDGSYFGTVTTKIP